MTNDYSLSDIKAVTGNGNNGMWGGDNAWWIIILFLFCFNGGWGNGFGNNGMNGGTGSEVQRGFDHSSVVTKLDGLSNGLCDGFYAQNSAIMNGFHGVDTAICGLGNTVQQGFNQTNVALLQGQNALASQMANCCCETREAIAGVRYDMATQACDTRHAIANGTRDIIDNANANSRAILDFLTKDKIATLQAENQTLKFQASQSAQNAFITANQEAQTAELIRRLGADCPQPAYVVQPPQPVTFPMGACGSFGCGA